jgi:hypothetical protein
MRVNQRFGGTCSLRLRGLKICQARKLATCFVLAYFLPYSSTLKIEATCCTETSVDYMALYPRRQNSSKAYLIELKKVSDASGSNIGSEKIARPTNMISA